ncbi:MAG: tail fiber domain-containing protein [Acidobacteriota bacterium]
MATDKRHRPSCLLTLFALALCAASAWAAPPVAQTDLSASGALWQPLIADYAAIDLTLTGPNDLYVCKTFAPGALVAVDLDALDGALDGLYTYELVVRPNVDADVLEAARAAGTTPTNVVSTPTQSGTFRVVGGAILTDRAAEPPAGSAIVDGDRPTEDQVIADDLIVDGSACVGFDCVNGESFGFDTLRLKENNLRLHFLDTSSTASFPSTDWRIIANDSANGGVGYLGFEDASAGRLVFRVEADAPSNALVVEGSGRVGFGTVNPVAELHVVDGDTPTLRLEQNGSSGFAPQTWDVAGNETNFFVRDASNGSALPFRIRSGAPTNAIYVDVDGDVGMGTSSPDASLNVEGNDGDTQVLITELNDTAATRELLSMVNNGRIRMALENTAVAGAGSKWVYDVNNGGNFAIIDTTDGAVEMLLNNNGNMTITGTLTENSDRRSKTNVETVDGAQVLDRVRTLAINTWSYLDGDPDVQHLGPMAQDFYALFGLGGTETGIATIDVAGVALAAIQGLDAKIATQAAEIASLKQENAEIERLKQENAALNARLAAIETMLRARADR